MTLFFGMRFILLFIYSLMQTQDHVWENWKVYKIVKIKQQKFFFKVHMIYCNVNKFLA